MKSPITSPSPIENHSSKESIPLNATPPPGQDGPMETEFSNFFSSSLSKEVDTSMSSSAFNPEVRKVFHEGTKDVVSRIANCQHQLKILQDKKATVFAMETRTQEEFNFREISKKSLSSDFVYFNHQLKKAMASLEAIEKHTMKRLPNKTTLLSIDEPVEVRQPKKNYRAIAAKDVPIFDVQPASLDSPVAELHLNNNHSLKSFVRKFERVYKQYDVDIEHHWFFHLEASFEQNSRYFNWFSQNMKSKEKISWSEAKVILQNRFDFSSRTSLIVINQYLLGGIKQSGIESIADYMDRYYYYFLASKVAVDNCFAITCSFLSSLFSEEFQQAVKSKMTTYMKDNTPLDQSSMGIKYAPRQDEEFAKFYKGFQAVIDAINYHILELEEVLQVIQRKAASTAKRVSGSGLSRGLKSKKRRIEEKSSGPSGNSGCKSCPNQQTKKQASNSKRNVDHKLTGEGKDFNQILRSVCPANMAKYIVNDTIL